MLVRGPGLADSMSRYLIQRIESTPNVVLRTRTQVEALEGERRPRAGAAGGTSTPASARRHDIRNLFLMTGADPNTDWLARAASLRDDKKFVKTGADLLPEDLAGARWPLPRRPHLLETSIPGVFCVGDARADQRQARRLRRGRGIDLRPARPPRAGRAVSET